MKRKYVVMNFKRQRPSINEARQTDMVDYLFTLGYVPAKIRSFDYWYLSPLREEKTPSFKVNRKLNRWYDHGIGKGGNIIDFAILYSNCTISAFMYQLSINPSFQKSFSTRLEEQPGTKPESKISILQDVPLSSFSLLRYLQQRRIPINLAKYYCREVKYDLNGKEYYGIGFRNNSGGYEIRNPYFKASSSPKDITTFNNGGKEIAVFEGFIDFLSFMAIYKDQSQILIDFVVLNSTAFFEKARPVMEQYDTIRLYLDRDKTGQNCSHYALSLSIKYTDESRLYENYKDLNDWLVKIGRAQKKALRYKF